MRTNRYAGRRVAPARKRKTFWTEYGYLLATVVVMFLLFRVVLQLAWVPSGSMETTIPTRSLLVSWRLPYLVSDPELQRGDVVTFQSDELGKLLVKRVVGLPGDEVSFHDGNVYINDKLLLESYLPEQGITGARGNVLFCVPEGCYFMLGDNRGASEDSRFWDDPYVPGEAMQAKVMLVISPFKESCWRGIRSVG